MCLVITMMFWIYQAAVRVDVEGQPTHHLLGTLDLTTSSGDETLKVRRRNRVWLLHTASERLDIVLDLDIGSNGGVGELVLSVTGLCLSNDNNVQEEPINEANSTLSSGNFSCLKPLVSKIMSQS